jgi:hypothetical protein
MLPLSRKSGEVMQKGVKKFVQYGFTLDTFPKKTLKNGSLKKYLS